MAAAALIVLACTSGPPATPTPGPEGQPTIVIESPASGSPTLVGQPLVVQARALDTIGVSRIDLRVGDILIDSVSAPGGVPQSTFAAALRWTPSAESTVSVSVIAYRADGTPSAPATITVAVIREPGSTIPPTPGSSPTAEPSPTPSPTVTPTAAARPTLPPFATATPSPSPSPIAIDLAVSAEGLPGTWIQGMQYTFNVIVANLGAQPAPGVPVRVRVCQRPPEPCSSSGGFNGDSGPLEPGASQIIEATVQPQAAGDRALRLRILVPGGYVDINPADNEVFYNITVQAPPSPSPSPSPTPSESPSEEPTEEP